MSIEQLVEAHHRLGYSNNVQMVAQQIGSRLRSAVTEMACAGNSYRAAALIGTGEYEVAEERTRRNAELPVQRSSRWLIRPQEVRSGQYIDAEDKLDMVMDPQSQLVQVHTERVLRSIDDTILGIRPVSGGAYEVLNSGILGQATEGKRADVNKVLPTGNYIAHNYGSGGTGLSLDKLRKVKLDLNSAEFGMSDTDQIYCAITPTQVDDLIGIAAATNQSLNAFAVEQLRTGKPTMLMGLMWIVTNRLPVDSNGYRLCPVWSKKNIILGVWQDIYGAVWRDGSADNLPYVKAAVRADCVRVEDGGVRVIRCEEA